MLQTRDLAALCQSGLKHLSSEHLGDAQRDFLAVTAQDPDHLPSLLALSVIASKLHQRGPTISYLQRVVALAPQSATYLLLLARAFRDSGRYPEAAPAYRAALLLDPSNNEARFECAWNLTEAGDLDEAMACYFSLVQAARHSQRRTITSQTFWSGPDERWTLFLITRQR